MRCDFLINVNKIIHDKIIEYKIIQKDMTTKLHAGKVQCSVLIITRSFFNPVSISLVLWYNFGGWILKKKSFRLHFILPTANSRMVQASPAV